MKTHTKLLFYSMLAVLSSCQKVIDIDLKDNDAVVMIEGSVSDDATQAATVKITKSVNFSEDNVFPPVSNASVTIRDHVGHLYVLTETSPGIYQNSALIGVPGTTYFLDIVAEDKTYSAVSTMPSKINLDTLFIGEAFGPGPPGGKAVTPVYTDPEGKGNNYRFKLTKNRENSKSIFLFDDQIVDGGENSRTLTDPNLSFETGDTAIVTMMCIDESVRLYFFSLSQNGNGPDASATPANPVSNINGATLGYFSAHSIQTKKAITP